MVGSADARFALQQLRCLRGSQGRGDGGGGGAVAGYDAYTAVCEAE